MWLMVEYSNLGHEAEETYDNVAICLNRERAHQRSSQDINKKKGEKALTNSRRVWIYVNVNWKLLEICRER